MHGEQLEDANFRQPISLNEFTFHKDMYKAPHEDPINLPQKIAPERQNLKIKRVMKDHPKINLRKMMPNAVSQLYLVIVNLNWDKMLLL
jgi:hypothetical protein